MSLGVALGVGSAVSGIGSRRRGDDAEDEANKNKNLALGELGKVTDNLDKLQPTIDKFAQMGQDEFDRYNRMNGSMEDVLNEHYMNLDPDQYAAQGNQTAQQTYQNTMNQVNDQLIAQGINPNQTGLSTQMGMQMGNQMAQTKAQNIMNAPQQVADMQQQWLGYTSGAKNNAYNQYASGVNAQTGMTDKYNQAYNNMASVYAGESANYNQAAQNAYNQGNQSLASGMAGVGYFGNEAGWFNSKKPETFQQIPNGGPLANA